MTQFSTDLSPDEALAAEFVLGTLNELERAQVKLRRLAEPVLEELIMWWEQNFAPWVLAAPEIAPPADLFAKIEAAIHLPNAVAAASFAKVPGSPVGVTASNEPANDNFAALRRQMARWRAAALTAGALAASMFVGVGVQQYASLSSPKNFVAVLQKDANSPAFVVSVNVESRALSIRPVSATAPQGKSYELWIINDKIGAPKSLGVVQNAGFTTAPQLKQYSSDIVQAGLYAITEEPAGGSPDGKPSGAPVFAGKLVEAP